MNAPRSGCLRQHITALSEHLADTNTTLIDRLTVQAWGQSRVDLDEPCLTCPKPEKVRLDDFRPSPDIAFASAKPRRAQTARWLREA
jgi:hypothetical protein